MKNKIIIFVLSLIISGWLQAEPINRNSVPQPLQPWVDWVLDGEKELGCPYRFDSSERLCAWPSRLQLELDDNGGTFTQHWQLYADSLVRLPGDERHWPQQVSSEHLKQLNTSSKPVLVLQAESGQPYAELKAGEHKITGRFSWQTLPESLYITPEVGLIELTVKDKQVERPQFDEEGRLWLMQTKVDKVAKDNMDIQVFRKLYDGHPIGVETLIKLRVSGKQRNAVLGPVLLDKFIATHIYSELPTRLEGEQQLTIQLRPGEWSITVRGRAPSDQTEFVMPQTQAPWPEQEVWVFDNDPTMRQVQVTGVNSIDPNQTRLPKRWQGLPAYLMSPQKALSLDVRERGVSEQTHNKVTLTREMWLDFDGDGYSIKDHLSGELQQSRINVLPELELGRVSINKQPQFITREINKEATGVEVRQRNVHLDAESRYQTSVTTIPVNGWQVDLDNVDTRLYLPPGWRVLAVNGVDNKPNTWVQKWSLMDLFLVMIIVLSIRHFFGWQWAGFALVSLVLTWQEPNAPRLIWLNLLAVVALLKVLSKYPLAKFLKYYRWGSLGLLALILLSYMIDTVRVSIYPQLQAGYTQQWQSVKQLRDAEVKRDQKRVQTVSEANQKTEMLEEIVVTGISSSRYASSAPAKAYKPKKADLKAIDPNSLIQSGPGLPDWHGYQTLNLHWSGPIKADEQSRILLLSPVLNSIFKLAGILLLLILAWCFLRTPSSEGDDPNTAFKFNFTGLKSAVTMWFFGCLLLVAMLGVNSQPAYAQSLPNQAMLEDLKERLTKSPDCLYSCAQIEQMQLNLSAESMQIRLRVHAATDTFIPLPGSVETWLPQQVIVNGQSNTGLSRREQQLWLSLSEGLHDVTLIGGLSKRLSLPLSLPLKPNFSAWQSTDNSWTIDGINQNGVASTQLQLNRVVSAEQQKDFKSDSAILPTFVRVSRQLQLGLDWYVQTTVSRVSPSGAPFNINIPLLQGEQVLDEELVVLQQQANLNFAANQSVISWSSRLTVSEKINLLAADTTNYIESWEVSTSPIWHISTEGIPVNRYVKSGDNQQTVAPVWQPWPKESLLLHIHRPAGVAGQVLTVQGSQMQVSVGKRVNDVSLKLAIRSSRGLEHKVTLPDNADVQKVTIDDIEQRVQDSQKEISLTLKPGKQDVMINWREPSARKLVYTLPKVDLQIPSVNAHSELRLPQNRWVLWTNGPLLGPAVLFWGVLIALFCLSLILGLSKLTPLKTWQWFLLSIGLSQTEPVLILVVVACFVGLSLRDRFASILKEATKHWQFNTIQLLLCSLVFVSLIIMAVAIGKGLLGSPDMQITGNGSYAHLLKWYQDRTELLPQPVVVSVPVWVYRVLMLAWAMWLAISLLKWLQWGWQALINQGIWRKAPVIQVDQNVKG